MTMSKIVTTRMTDDEWRRLSWAATEYQETVSGHMKRVYFDAMSGVNVQAGAMTKELSGVSDTLQMMSNSLKRLAEVKQMTDEHLMTSLLSANYLLARANAQTMVRMEMDKLINLQAVEDIVKGRK